MPWDFPAIQACVPASPICGANCWLSPTVHGGVGHSTTVVTSRSEPWFQRPSCERPCSPEFGTIIMTPKRSRVRQPYRPAFFSSGSPAAGTQNTASGQSVGSGSATGAGCGISCGITRPSQTLLGLSTSPSAPAARGTRQRTRSRPSSWNVRNSGRILGGLPLQTAKTCGNGATGGISPERARKRLVLGARLLEVVRCTVEATASFYSPACFLPSSSSFFCSAAFAFSPPRGSGAGPALTGVIDQGRSSKVGCVGTLMSL